MLSVMLHSGLFSEVRTILGRQLLEAPKVDVGEWQSIKDARSPMNQTHELENVCFQIDIPDGFSEWQTRVGPNLPWAEDHFQERVSGQPLNPPPSEEYWPFAVKGNSAHKEGEKFSHTYPERFWPKVAGVSRADWYMDATGEEHPRRNRGIRFEYGDLNDVVSQIGRSPGTRQAYLPVWFPEDTGAVHGERVPCTLGYHFLVRMQQLNMTYFIRSCDFVRHFPDDVYMAGRLAQWVCLQLRQYRLMLSPGTLTMHIVSLHVFENDMPNMRKWYGSND